MPAGLSEGEAFLVIFAIAVPVAAIAFIGAGAALKNIGKGRFSVEFEQDLPQQATQEPAAASPQDREAEIRQMVEAKAYRQQARGETPVDVEAEVGRLLHEGQRSSGLGEDPQLVAEVRQLVIARNARRQRRGEEPLDVEAEVERQLRELENLGQ